MKLLDVIREARVHLRENGRVSLRMRRLGGTEIRLAARVHPH